MCSECGTSHPKWAGRCAGCGDWNTLVEDIEVSEEPIVASTRPGPTLIGEVGTEHGHPTSTSITELDRVLGGGLVAGSVTLLGGEPGIGKSTLLLQLLASWTGPTLYVTAEESAQQVKRRAERLGATARRPVAARGNVAPAHPRRRSIASVPNSWSSTRSRRSADPDARRRCRAVSARCAAAPTGS